MIAIYPNSSVKHTPGEWKVGGGRTIIARAFYGSWKLIVDKVRGGSEDEAEANAYLIAAAPEMLEALDELSSAVYDGLRRYAAGDSAAIASNAIAATLRQAGAAIRKAKGETAR